ncbi:MAG: hypothetical protein U1E76_06530 [Planctomycetota bacterium]
MRKILIALCVFLAGFLTAVGWLRPYVPFFSRYTDGVSEKPESHAIRYAVWDTPQSIGQPTNSADDETRPALSYAGDWMFYEVGEVGANADIWMAPIVEGVAQPGHPAPFNSAQDDISPFCDDGRYLYFASNRAGGRGGFDLFRAPLTPNGAGDAEPLPGDVNTAANEVDPAIRPGTLDLYFASDRRGRRPGYDLYRAIATTDGYHASEPLTALNSSDDEREPGFSPDGMVVFFASNRAGGIGGFDLWRSLEDHGKLLAPENVAALNSQADDRSPCPAAEGFSLLFASSRDNGHLDIYRATTHELFKKPLRPLGLSDFTYVALLLLAALFAYLARRFQTLDFLAKCILLSLLVHVLFMLWMRRVEVKTELSDERAAPRSFRVRLEGTGTVAEAGGGGQGRGFREQQLAALAQSVGRAASDAPGEELVPGNVALALDREPPSYGAARTASADQPQSTSAVTARVLFTEPLERAHEGVPELKLGAATLLAGHAEPAPARPASAGSPAGELAAGIASPAAAPVGRSERSLEAAARGPGATPLPSGDSAGAGAGLGVRGVAVAAPHEDHAILGASSARFAPVPAAIAASDGTRELGRAPAASPGSSPGSTNGAGDGGAALTPGRAPPIGRSADAGPSGGEARGAPALERAGASLEVALSAPAEARLGAGAGGDAPGASGSGLALAPREVASSGRGIELQRAGSPSGLPGASTSDLAAQATAPPALEREAAPQSARPAGSGASAAPERPGAPAVVRAALPSIGEPMAPLAAPPGGGGSGTGTLAGAGGLAPREVSARAPVAALERFHADLALDPLPEPSKVDLVPRDVERPAPAPPARDLGVYSRRFGEEKQIAIKTYGGSAETERAVAQGLQYLASIQNRDGRWGSSQDDDDKYGQVMVGKTALCLLAFLGAGHTPQSSTPYSDVTARAVKFLLSVQDDRSGHFGFTSAYSHGTATYALAECYAITRAPELREPLERAVDHILSEQHENRRDRKDNGGWGYFYPNGRVFDRWPRASISAWQVMALKSARLGGLDIPEQSFRDARSFLLNCWDAEIGAFRYNHDPSRLRSSYATLPGSTPAALFALSLLGELDHTEPAITGGFEFIRERRPREYAYRGEAAFVNQAAGNPYFWYYATLATFVRGGSDWEEWNTALKATLLPAQQQNGSWRPLCIYARYAGDDDRDRSYTTSLCVLMLEVYYRYFTPLLRATSK